MPGGLLSHALALIPHAERFRWCQVVGCHSDRQVGVVFGRLDRRVAALDVLGY